MEKNLAQKAYAKAMQRLRAAHRDEFVVLLGEVYDEMGLTVKRRRSTEERQAALDEAAAVAKAKRDARSAAKEAAAASKLDAKRAKLQADLDALNAG